MSGDCSVARARGQTGCFELMYQQDQFKNISHLILFFFRESHRQ